MEGWSNNWREEGGRQAGRKGKKKRTMRERVGLGKGGNEDKLEGSEGKGSLGETTTGRKEEGMQEGKKKGWTKGRKEGRKEGRKKGRKDGRKEGTTKGGKEGRKEGRTKGRKDERKEGRKDERKEGRKEGRKEEKHFINAPLSSFYNLLAISQGRYNCKIYCSSLPKH